ATFIDVRCLFSQGCLLLSHVHSCLSAKSTHTLLCLGYWCHLNLIKDDDISKVIKLPDLTVEQDIKVGWDSICVD
ncbi:hypothetical protein HD554DRAFT_2025817, partial [Boletus coccyginus]